MARDRAREKKYGRHSKAGYSYLQMMKKKKAETQGLSGRTKRELSYYSDVDRQAILRALSGKDRRRGGK